MKTISLLASNQFAHYVLKPTNLFASEAGKYEIAIIVFAVIASLLIAISYIPQLKYTIKTKGTTGLSFYMWLLSVIAEIVYVVWAIVLICQYCVLTTPWQMYKLGALQVFHNNVLVKDPSNNVLKYLLSNISAAVYHQAYQVDVQQGLIDGVSLLICNITCTIVAGIILVYKINNVQEAKKLQITEAELCNQKYKAILKQKEQQ